MISVVVSVYNVEKYLEKCLESIIRQSLSDYEVIIVDDGSKDGSVDVAKNYLKDKNIDWQLVSKENGGQGSARNAGLKHAKGEYVVFIDSDDVISDDFLERLYENVSKDSYDFSFCGFKYVKEQIPPVDDSTEYTEYDRDSLVSCFLKRTISFVLPSMMFRKSFLLDNGLWFNENTRFSEDQYFMWEVILSSHKTVYMNRKMYGYYLRENSIMTGSPYDKICIGIDEYSKFCDSLKERYPEYDSMISKILPRWELGTLYSCAKLVPYDQYLDLYQRMNGRTLLKRVMGIGESKAYLLALVSSISPKLIYALCRKMRLE